MQHAFFLLCRAAGRILRGGRYSSVTFPGDDGAVHVRKYRRFYAPLLVRLGDPLVRLLDTGMRVLPQREWKDRERLLYRDVHSQSIDVEGDDVLILPRLPGETLASLLQRPELGTSERKKAIGLAVVALKRFHDSGHTHGDAMAENVLVDLDAGAAHWFDFETVHDESRSPTWRRADDVRALLATCLLRARDEEFAGMLSLILDVYADEHVTQALATFFTSGPQRALVFHLGQAPLSFAQYGEIARLLRARAGG